MKIALLGGSNCVLAGGLAAGLAQAGWVKSTEKAPEPKGQNGGQRAKITPLANEVRNFSLGNCGSLQNLFEAIRQEEFLRECDLIVNESALNDTGWAAFTHGLGSETIIKNIHFLYEALFAFQRPVLVLLLPFGTADEWYNYGRKNLHRPQIFAAHLECAAKYGFSLINAYDYYRSNALFNAFNADFVHEPNFILHSIGSLIAKNISLFSPPKRPEELGQKAPAPRSYRLIGAGEIQKFITNETGGGGG